MNNNKTQQKMRAINLLFLSTYGTQSGHDSVSEVAILHRHSPTCHHDRQKKRTWTASASRVGAPLLTRLELEAMESDVLSTEDIVVGVGLALGLAFISSYLQGQRSQSDVILWRQEQMEALEPLSGGDGGSNGTIVFGEASWKEISQPENYVWYNTKVKKKLDGKGKASLSESPIFRTEKKWVLLALLVFFVPVFSFEFFLALSRQIICYTNPMTQSEWAEWLCSPHIMD